MGYLQNPEQAVAYLNAALEEGDSKLFLVALQNVAKASGKEADWFEQLEMSNDYFTHYSLLLGLWTLNPAYFKGGMSLKISMNFSQKHFLTRPSGSWQVARNT